MTTTTAPKTRAQLPKALADSLRQVLASTNMLTLQLQGHHWNVTGPLFQPLHTMFEEQYNDSFAAQDVIAERLRALGEPAPATFALFTELSVLSDGSDASTAQERAHEAEESHLAMAELLREGVETSEEHDDVVTADLFTQRAATHEKFAWMLRSVVVTKEQKAK